MSYNILADIYTNAEHARGKYNLDYLNFRERSSKIMAEIKESDPDLVCLQEVDNYDTVYKPFLNKLGYECHIEWRREDDAVLIGYKTDKFELRDTLHIQYNDLKKRFRHSIFLKGNTAIVAKLRYKATSKELIVATTHIHWNPKLDFIKYAQMFYLFEKI